MRGQKNNDIRLKAGAGSEPLPFLLLKEYCELAPWRNENLL